MTRVGTLAVVLLVLIPVAPVAAASSLLKEGHAWATAHEQGALSAEETKAFMRALAEYVRDRHLKQAADSAQRGMVYEYLQVRRIGEFDQWIQGEALDTMHDGAWYAAAMTNAARATGDPFYKAFLTKRQLPFYLKMLNHSDRLFPSAENDAAPDAHRFPKTHRLIPGEKGFIPYWWDDGASVSLERRVKDQKLGAFECHDNLADKPNPKHLLDGYSLGMSNHMAQDIAVMLETAWLLLKDAEAEADRRLADETARAARHLHASRVRHHGRIPMCTAAAALANRDADLLRHVPDPTKRWTPRNHYTDALYTFEQGRTYGTPVFSDDQQYDYYWGLARTGGRMAPALAFRVVYDAFTQPMLWRYFCDDVAVPPGINRGEYGFHAADGALAYYHSDDRGVRFLGSRLGPQNMICSGWALQILRARPGLWEQRYEEQFAGDVRVYVDDPPPGATAPKPVPAAEVALGPAALHLKSTRTHLLVSGKGEEGEVTLRIYGGPEPKGRHAAVTVRRDGTVRAVNHEGKDLVVQDASARPEGAKGVAFGFRLPYTVVKGQGVWANGIEHGRYALAVGDAVRTLYLASPEWQVAAHLERELGRGLTTWRAVFEHYGYIPTHFGRSDFWDHLSDSGGYAHLISAGAQWLLCLEGKRDWEDLAVPTVLPE
jgi:hypothetical protein